MTTSSEYLRSPELLSHAGSRLLIIDVQEKLLPSIPTAGRLVFNCRRLIEAAHLFNVPVSATEQYPKGLGSTELDLRGLVGDAHEKVRFSSAEVLGWGGASDAVEDRRQVVVAGMEAHVCVQQTVLDLIAEGWRVYVVADAVASRSELDWEFALRRTADCGAVVTTTESVLFEWCEAAGSDEFRKISELVKRQFIED